jgi:predicted nucleotidyltransferase
MMITRLGKSSRLNWPREVRGALRDLRISLRRMYGQQVPALLLYGSYARGEAEEASDVDVMLIYPVEVPPGHEINRLGSILADLNLRYQVLISVLPVSEQAYQSSSGIFWKNIRQEGVLLG